MQECLVPQVEEPVGPWAVVTATERPTDTKDRLDRRNQGTEGVAATERQVGNPMRMVTVASAVDFRQAVDPRRSLIYHSALRWLHYQRFRTDLGQGGVEQRH